MKRYLFLTFLLFSPAGPSTAARPILDGIGLNIGISCQWQTRCMAQQHRAMRRALDYVARSHPPQWRIQLCNRNASRGGGRVDWSGFDHCIRNGALKPAPVRTRRRR